MNRIALMCAVVLTHVSCTNLLSWEDSQQGYGYHRSDARTQNVHSSHHLNTGEVGHPDPYAPPDLYSTSPRTTEIEPMVSQQREPLRWQTEQPLPRSRTRAPTDHQRDHHRVTSGETLYSIATRYGMNWRDLARRNGLTPPFQILPGDMLAIDAASNPQLQPRQATGTPARAYQTKLNPPSNAGYKHPLVSNKHTANDWRWPHPGSLVRSYDRSRNQRPGIDLAGMLGDVVIASRPGRVVYEGDGLAHYGKLVIIKHDEQFMSAYAYNRKLLVTEGQWIEAGDPIAEMGSREDGMAAVYFEIRRSGQPIDPTSLLPRR